MTDTEKQLEEAEAALAASMRALETHGHQGITWALFKADSERVARLRAELMTGATQ